MGMRAVTTITDHTGTRAFRAAWASPEYQIPHLADFLTWADDHHRLTVDTWLAYADTFPGTLPREEVTGTRAAARGYVGDLSFRYRLRLLDDVRDVRLRVYARPTPGHDRLLLVADLTRATLYLEAARHCDLLADRARQWTARNGGTLPGGEDPDQWRRRADEFRARHDTPAHPAPDPAGSPPAGPFTFLTISEDGASHEHRHHIRAGDADALIRHAVGGWPDLVPHSDPGLGVWCDDDSRLIGRPANPVAARLVTRLGGHPQPLAGPVAVAGRRGHTTVSLTDRQVDVLLAALADCR